MTDAGAAGGTELSTTARIAEIVAFLRAHSWTLNLHPTHALLPAQPPPAWPTPVTPPPPYSVAATGERTLLETEPRFRAWAEALGEWIDSGGGDTG